MHIYIDRIGEPQAAKIKKAAEKAGLDIKVGCGGTFEYGTNAGGWRAVRVEGAEEDLYALIPDLRNLNLKPGKVLSARVIADPAPWR